MIELIIVSVVVLGAGFWALRTFFRTITGKNDGCTCMSHECSKCPSKKL